MKNFKNNSHLSYYDIISFILISYLTIASVYPPLRVIGNSTVISIVALCLWFLWTFMITPKYYIKIKKANFIIIIFVIYTVSIPYFFGNSIIGNRYLSLSIMIIFQVIYDYYKTYNKLDFIKYIIYTTMSFAMITLFRTIIGLMDNPYLSRSIKSSGEYSLSILNKGIGGYEFIYFLAILSTLVIYLLIRQKRFFKKAILAIILSLIILCILLSNYFTALIFTIFSALALIFVKILRNKNKIYMLIFIFVVIIIFTFSNYLIDGLSNTIIELSPRGKNAIRIIELRNSFFNKGGSELDTDRFVRIKETIIQTFKNPIFGLIGTRMTKNGGYFIGFGQHSHITDTFALYGIFVGIVNLYILTASFFKRLKGNNKELTVIIMILGILILFFNNATISIGLALWIIYPYIDDNLLNSNIKLEVDR